jgi:predicted lactoylglutathione lyase
VPRLVFINLPVSDLARAIAFYEAVGGHVNPQFSDETGACIVLSETIHVMLLTHAKYAQFTPKTIADTHRTSATLIALTMESPAEIDAVVAAGAAAGGRADPSPKQDHGFMVSRSVEDPDGHVWEMFWMDPAALPGAAPTD